MSKVFISHSSADKYFVDLLARILQHHYIDVWYDSKGGIEIGEKYKTEIEKGLKNSDYLIIIVSKNSINSKWVTRELATFTAIKGESFLIPIFLEALNPDEVFDGLKEVQGILFYQNMLSGFQSLLAVFGKQFLERVDRREKLERRTDDRRSEDDRRASNIAQRLRIGFWKCYSSKYDDTKKFDNYELSASNRRRALDALPEEIMKYDFFDKNGVQQELSIRDFDRITYEVWEELSGRSYLTAIIVIEELAERINSLYVVSLRDRREENRRSDQSRRAN